MFKRIALTALSICFFGSLAFAGNADSENKNYNRSGVQTENGTFIFRVSSSGHILNEVGDGELGSPNYPWAKLYLSTNGIITSTGVSRHHETFVDLPGGDDDVVLNSNNQVLTLATLVTAGTTYIASDLIQSTVPRNVIIFASVSVSALSQTSATLTATCYIRGLDALGRSTYTYQTVVTTNNAAVGVGNIAWSYISSMTITATSSGTVVIDGNKVDIQIGTGEKIGLVNDLDSTTDIYHVNEAGTVTTTYTANSTYNTIDFVTDGNSSRDYDVRYIQKYFTPLP